MKRLEHHHGTLEERILTALAKGPLTPAQLAVRCQVTRGPVYTCLGRLVASGAIEAECVNGVRQKQYRKGRA